MKKKCKHQQKRIVQNKYLSKLIRINLSKKKKEERKKRRKEKKEEKIIAIALITMIQWLLILKKVISNRIYIYI